MLNNKNTKTKHMKTLFKTTLIAILLLTFSCSKDDNTEQEQVTPTIVTNMSPLSGPKTTVVTFTGTNFGRDINAVQIFFDDIEATVQSVTNTQIQTTVPPRAFFGEVRLVIDGTEFTGFDFEYEIVDIQVSTLAGSTSGYLDGATLDAQFNQVYDVAVDGAGNLYVADTFNHKIRKITAEGIVSTFAGSTEGFADGPGSTAQFDDPRMITVDLSGNVYVTDRSNHAIRKITPSGVVSTLAGGNPSLLNTTGGFADGTGIDAEFALPRGITVDSSGNLYVTDTNNHAIRKITPNGEVTTLAGGSIGSTDGIGGNAKFTWPRGITIDSSDNLYVCDSHNHKIRKITPNGDVTTIAGSTQGFANGSVNIAKFSFPQGIAIDDSDNLYISDTNNDKIRKITPNGQVSTFAGSTNGTLDGTGSEAQFLSLQGMTIDSNRNIYVADRTNDKIRKITQE